MTSAIGSVLAVAFLGAGIGALMNGEYFVAACCAASVSAICIELWYGRGR